MYGQPRVVDECSSVTRWFLGTFLLLVSCLFLTACTSSKEVEASVAPDEFTAPEAPNDDLPVLSEDEDLAKAELPPSRTQSQPSRRSDGAREPALDVARESAQAPTASETQARSREKSLEQPAHDSAKLLKERSPRADALTALLSEDTHELAEGQPVQAEAKPALEAEEPPEVGTTLAEPQEEPGLADRAIANGGKQSDPIETEPVPTGNGSGSLLELPLFVTGLVLVLLVVGAAFFIPDPSTFQYRVFRTILALGAAGVAASIPGFFNFDVPLKQASIQSGGALGVFVLVYWFDPAGRFDDG